MAEMRALLLLLLCLDSLLSLSSAQQCGDDVGGVLCPNNLCCSKWGYCGTTSEYCCDGCQSQCDCTGPTPTTPPPPVTPSPPPNPDGVIKVINSSIFDELLPKRNDPRCHAVGFYTFDVFVAAADTFPEFGTTGDTETRQREVCAFIGQTSQETTGGWAGADGGQFAWGYCYKEENNGNVTSDYCNPSNQWPCVPGKKYYGRGPIQLSYNGNYGLAGEALGLGLLGNPDLVAQDPMVAFRTAFWFWMTPQSPKPSCHDVIVENWEPTEEDKKANRLPGYGVITNIINGERECGRGYEARVWGRIEFYKRCCDIYGISYGENLDCYSQQHFGGGGLATKAGQKQSKAIV